MRDRLELVWGFAIRSIKTWNHKFMYVGHTYPAVSAFRKVKRAPKQILYILNIKQTISCCTMHMYYTDYRRSGLLTNVCQRELVLSGPISMPIRVANHCLFPSNSKILDFLGS